MLLCQGQSGRSAVEKCRAVGYQGRTAIEVPDMRRSIAAESAQTISRLTPESSKRQKTDDAARECVFGRWTSEDGLWKHVGGGDGFNRKKSKRLELRASDWTTGTESESEMEVEMEMEMLCLLFLPLLLLLLLLLLLSAPSYFYSVCSMPVFFFASSTARHLRARSWTCSSRLSLLNASNARSNSYR